MSADVDALRAENERLSKNLADERARWRSVTSTLGYGDGVTEPQIGHLAFIAEMEKQARDADEWIDSQLWRNDCYEAGHDELEDCWEHDPNLRRQAAESKLAEVSHILSRRSAALGRVVGEKRTLEARLENVEALAARLVAAGVVSVYESALEIGQMVQDALDAPVPSWRVLCPHGGCADPDSCRDAVRADTLGDN